MNKIIVIICFLFFSYQIEAQQYIGKTGVITFFSEAPMEDISAINKKVSAVYDAKTNDIVFQLKIKDFIFPKSLMQEHFNENYLESDIFPNATFQGKVLDPKTYVQTNGKTRVEGDLTIHGQTNKIIVEGEMARNKDKIKINAKFSVKLVDYNIDIPTVVMYKIAEEIEIDIDIELHKI